MPFLCNVFFNSFKLLIRINCCKKVLFPYRLLNTFNKKRCFYLHKYFPVYVIKQINPIITPYQPNYFNLQNQTTNFIPPRRREHVIFLRTQQQRVPVLPFKKPFHLGRNLRNASDNVLFCASSSFSGPMKLVCTLCTSTLPHPSLSLSPFRSEKTRAP